MTEFFWTNGEGQQLNLDDPTAIEAEMEEISQDIDAVIGMLDDPDRFIRDMARKVIQSHRPRMEKLQADLARWNVHAAALIREGASQLVILIDGLPEMLAEIEAVVSLHDEHEQVIEATWGAPAMQQEFLARPATAIQRWAISVCDSRDKPLDPTRAEAKAWLDCQPRFARVSNEDDGWFAWIDRHGHAHRLVDPLPIEREMVVFSSELTRLRPALSGSDPVDAVHAAVSSGVASWNRLAILKGDLERFEREAETRDRASCKTFAADWRSKRSES